MQPAAGARWRPWVILIISAVGILTALGFSLLLMLAGGINLLDETLPASNSLPIINLGWASTLVAVLCIPGLVFSILELRGKTLVEKPGQRNLIFASLAFLVWIGLVFLFKPLETSRIAWLVLPPLVILTTVIPLWWYLEAGRRGLSGGTHARTWGVVSFSLVVSLPLILLLELFVLILILSAAGIYIGAQPELTTQLEQFAQQLSDFNYNPEMVQGLLGDLLQKPGVIAITLAVAAGIIPLLEELFKPLAVWLLAGERLTPAQGFVAGMWSGACFALYENLTALSAAGNGDGTTILLARVGTGLLHMVTAGLVGWGLASAWGNIKNLGRLVIVYLLAVFLHGAWNAAGVIAGIAPFLSLPANASTLFAGMGQTAAITLFVLIGLNLVLLFVINFRLRKEAAGEASLELTPPQAPVPSQAGEDLP